MSNDPFYIPLPPTTSVNLTPEAADVEARLCPQPRDTDGTYMAHEDNSDFLTLFEASVKGVHGSFKHLSEDDIVYPPHRFFDAALARQIALHLLVNRFDVPKNRIVSELRRSKLAVRRALDVIDERLLSQEFADTYEQIADRTQSVLDGASDDS